MKARSDVPDCPKTATPPAAGALPAIEIDCLGGGRSVDLAGLRGPMIINVWASWCPPCREELPALATYARSHPEVKVLGIDYMDAQPEEALRLAMESEVGYPLLADPSGRLDRRSPFPHLAALPFSMFVDASGEMVGREFSVLDTESKIERAVDQYLQ